MLELLAKAVAPAVCCYHQASDGEQKSSWKDLAMQALITHRAVVTWLVDAPELTTHQSSRVEGGSQAMSEESWTSKTCLW